ncbi:M24 family metallopeptidase [Kocuria palustris]|nr:M24 family metallopeptidase [Kocuria palustris]
MKPKAAATKEAKPDTTIANPAVVEKYKMAGDISSRVLAAVLAQVAAGKTTYELSVAGDELMEEELGKVYNLKKTKKTPKGIAFPTCVNPNHIPAHLAPLNADEPSNITLADGDVVNVMLGVQIDGNPAVVAGTVVVGALESLPVTGAKADLLQLAWTALEAAIRTLRPGKRNWDVTNIVDKVAKAYGTSPVELMLSHNQEQNMLYGPKEIILNPTPQNKKEMLTHRFEENEVYGLDILISTSDNGKVKNHPTYRTTLYKLTGGLYALKMKLSHRTLTEFREKANNQLFPMNIRKLDDPARARGGLLELANHQVVLPYDIYTEKEGEYIAQFFTTVAITKNGLVLLSHPEFNADLYKSDKKVDDEQVLQTLAEPLKPAKEKDTKA